MHRKTAIRMILAMISQTGLKAQFAGRIDAFTLDLNKVRRIVVYYAGGHREIDARDVWEALE